MKMSYKRTLVPLPFCSTCSHVIEGNGSIVMPYRCECGFWRSNWQDPSEYTIEPYCACSVKKGIKNPNFTHHSEYECGNQDLGLLKAGTGPKE